MFSPNYTWKASVLFIIRDFSSYLSILIDMRWVVSNSYSGYFQDVSCMYTNPSHIHIRYKSIQIWVEKKADSVT